MSTLCVRKFLLCQPDINLAPSKYGPSFAFLITMGLRGFQLKK